MALNEPFPRNEPLPKEKGIIRNREGRIVETGWPNIPRSEWRYSYKELGSSVSDQIQMELSLRGRANRDVFGALMVGSLRFNLNDTHVLDYLKTEIEIKMNDGTDRGGKIVSLCDLGGGAGTLLAYAGMDYKGRYKKSNKFGRELNATLTRLSILGDDDLRRTRDYVDKVVTTSIELPPDDFYGAFDIIAAQNSVYFWSQYPELATLNMWKMLKKNGVVIATVPPQGVKEPSGKPFDILTYLESSRLFNLTELGVTNTRTSTDIIKMEKIG